MKHGKLARKWRPAVNFSERKAPPPQRTSLISHFIKPSDRCLRVAVLGPRLGKSEDTHAVTIVTSANRSYPLPPHELTTINLSGRVIAFYILRGGGRSRFYREAERLIRDKSDGLATTSPYPGHYPCNCTQHIYDDDYIPPQWNPFTKQWPMEICNQTRKHLPSHAYTHNT